jgi:hypothetical protein
MMRTEVAGRGRTPEPDMLRTGVAGMFVMLTATLHSPDTGSHGKALGEWRCDGQHNPVTLGGASPRREHTAAGTRQALYITDGEGWSGHTSP